jgi:hypothetical protein
MGFGKKIPQLTQGFGCSFKVFPGCQLDWLRISQGFAFGCKNILNLKHTHTNIRAFMVC